MALAMTLARNDIMRTGGCFGARNDIMRTGGCFGARNDIMQTGDCFGVWFRYGREKHPPYPSINSGHRSTSAATQKDSFEKSIAFGVLRDLATT